MCIHILPCNNKLARYISWSQSLPHKQQFIHFVVHMCTTTSIERISLSFLNLTELGSDIATDLFNNNWIRKG